MSSHGSFTWLGPDEPAAIALCQIDGESPPLDRPAPSLGCARFALLLDVQGSVVDEVVVTALTQHRWEIACHGGAGMRAAVSTTLLEHGFAQEEAPSEDPWQPWVDTLHPAALRIYAREGSGHAQPWQHLVHRPIRILLTGPVNAGKSTLLNTWCGQQRAVASAQPGTTRDLLRSQVLYAGWNFEIIDSAGLRRSAGAIEQAGQDLVAQARREADVVVFCWPQDAQISPALQDEDLLLFTKWDERQLPPDQLVWHAPAYGSPERSELLLDRLQQHICTRLQLPIIDS